MGLFGPNYSKVVIQTNSGRVLLEQLIPAGDVVRIYVPEELAEEYDISTRGRK